MNTNSTSQAIPFNFDGHEVRTMALPDGEAWFVAHDVAMALGYSNTRDALSRHCKGVVKHDAPTSSGIQSMSMIREPDVYRLIVKSRLPSAERFERWVFEEVLPTIRKTGGYAAQNSTPPRSLEDLMKAANVMADSLHLEGTSRITAMRAFSAANCPELLPMLPSYAIDAPATSGTGSSEVTHSASYLLKKHGISMSATAFNKVCHAQGLLERQSRTNSKGKEVEFWCITHAGLDYGKNVTAPQSPLQTQPHWYDEKFDDLLSLIGIQQQAA